MPERPARVGEHFLIFLCSQIKNTPDRNCLWVRDTPPKIRPRQSVGSVGAALALPENNEYHPDK